MPGSATIAPDNWMPGVVPANWMPNVVASDPAIEPDAESAVENGN